MQCPVTESKKDKAPASALPVRGRLLIYQLLILLVALTACQSPSANSTVTAVPATGESEMSVPTRTLRPTRTAILVTPPGTVGARSRVLATPPGAELLDVSADELTERAERIGGNERFVFYRTPGAYAPPLAQLQQRMAEIHESVTERLQTSGPEQIDVLFLPPDPSACPIRGTAGAAVGASAEAGLTFRILVYAGEETGPEQIYGVLAHELGHVMTMRKELHAGQIALSEGFASWAAGPYQTAWQGAASFDALVRRYLADGRYLPLHQHEDLNEVAPSPAPDAEGCLERRDILYSEWASFIGFLIDHYGFEQFLALIESTWGERSGNAVFSSPPDYEGVYGASLQELEEMWLASLDSEMGA